MIHMKGQFRAALLTLIFLLISFLPMVTAHLSAANPKKKLSIIEENIKKKKARVKAALKKEQSILSRILNIEKKIQNTELALRDYRKRISNTQYDIQSLNSEISSLSKKLIRRREYLRERLRSLYKQQYGDSALILISANDYNELIRRSRYISLIAYNDRKIMESFSRDLKDLRAKIDNIELQKRRLQESKVTAQKKKKTLQRSRIKKDRLLVTVRSKRSSYQKAIKELEESSRKLRELITKLDKQKIPKSVSGKGFKTWKRRLPWPIKVKIIVPYGKYKDPKFNIAVFKNGVEIKAKEGYRPKAVAGGRVVFADWFKGYGQLLIINHGDGFHSLYGHLTEIFHTTGDIIKQGTTIGKIGKSELLNVPTLYFEIRYKGKPVNPMKWLSKKSK